MVGSETNSGPASDLLVPLDRTAPVPLHRQIEIAIRDRHPVRPAAARRLSPADPRPSQPTSASPAASSSRPTSSSTAEGYLTSRLRRLHPGRGRPDRTVPPERACPRRRPDPDRLRLRPGRPGGIPSHSLAAFDPAGVRRDAQRRLRLPQRPRCPRAAARTGRLPQPGPGHGRRTDHMVISNGYAQGINLVVKVLAQRGATPHRRGGPVDQRRRAAVRRSRSA